MTDGKPVVPRWFLVAAIFALLWNLLGFMAFYMQATMTPEAMGALPAEQQRLFAERPWWVIWTLGGAVVAGVMGSLGLLLRKAWSLPVLAFSLAGVVAHHAYLFLLSDTFAVMGQKAMLMPLVVLAIAIGLVWLAFIARRKSWLA